MTRTSDDVDDINIDLLGLTDLVIFPAMPGDSYARAREQRTRFAREVRPLLPAENEVTP